mmetsp:Transcript_5656/g.11230  ORF Transcript_5656/g.11230 Transcript_5656/m.11230 type:complete len:132 (-) Transcript_5656:2045-2440(-)
MNACACCADARRDTLNAVAGANDGLLRRKGCTELRMARGKELRGGALGHSEQRLISSSSSSFLSVSLCQSRWGRRARKEGGGKDRRAFKVPKGIDGIFFPRPFSKTLFSLLHAVRSSLLSSFYTALFSNTP